MSVNYFVLIFTNFVLLEAQHANLENGSLYYPGYSSFSVLFQLINHKEKQNESAITKKDFSLESEYLAIGTILNLRWVLAKATPIAHYPTHTYQAVTHPGLDITKVYYIDTTLIHPEHELGSIKTDIALIRVSNDFHFNFAIGSVNLGLNNFDLSLEDCKIIYYDFLNNVVKETSIQVSIQINCDNSQYFLCLLLPTVNYLSPVNYGAPVICGNVMVGLYAGSAIKGASHFQPRIPSDLALRIDKGIVNDWIKYIMSEEIASKELQQIEEQREYLERKQDLENPKPKRNETGIKLRIVLKRCSSCQNCKTGFLFLILNVLLTKYFYF